MTEKEETQADRIIELENRLMSVVELAKELMSYPDKVTIDIIINIKIIFKKYKDF